MTSNQQYKATRKNTGELPKKHKWIDKTKQLNQLKDQKWFDNQNLSLNI